MSIISRKLIGLATLIGLLSVSVAFAFAYNENLFADLPPHASSVRLQLPTTIDWINADHIGGYGVHNGGHLEGIDHVWLEIDSSQTIGSWAAGEVVLVDQQGDGTGTGEVEWAIEIDYGDGLIGRHMEVRTPLVSVGDIVDTGDPIGVGLDAPYAGYVSAEFFLYDCRRADGIPGSSYQCASVSPYDYLNNEAKSSLGRRYQSRILDACSASGDWPYEVQPWEPYLQNPILVHADNPGTLIGEWLLASGWAVGGWPDILAILKVDHQYHTGGAIIANDDTNTGYHLHGSWTADYATGRMVIVSDGRWSAPDKTYYAIFQLDESTARARLRIEYQEGDYPTGFSADAAIYIERDRLQRRQDGCCFGGYQASWCGSGSNVCRSDEVIGRERFVSRLYVNFLGYTADADGLAALLGDLADGTITGAEAAGQFFQADVFEVRNVTDREYINLLYRALFNRTATDSETAGKLAALASGTSRSQMLTNLTRAAEFAVVCALIDIITY